MSIDKQVAEAQGWKIYADAVDREFDTPSWIENDMFKCLVSNYHPSTNMTQAMELLIKYKYKFDSVCFDTDKKKWEIVLILWSTYPMIIMDESLSVCICKAVCALNQEQIRGNI